RPLGRLLLEALQNAFDEQASRVDVELGPRELVVEDDVGAGIVDERLVYTLFFSDKPDDPPRRGRMGRGPRALTAGRDPALAGTVGTTLGVSAAGRPARAGGRARGTRLVRGRAFTESELGRAKQLLRLSIPPKGTTLRVGGQRVRRPRSVLTL